MNIKLLFIISKMSYGGAQRIISFLSNSLNRLGNDIYIYTYSGNSCYYPLDKEVTYIPEKNIWKNPIAKRVIPIFKVRKIIKDIKPDIVVSFLTNANFLSILGTLLTPFPVIISERSDPYNENNLSLSIMRLFYRFADGVVFQTDGAKEYYNELIQKKSKVIPNPVTISYKRKIPYNERNNQIAFVARFDIKQKRQDIMVEAFKRVVKNKKNIRLMFYGDGADMTVVRDMVSKYELTDYITFVGKVDDIQNHLEKAKLFVLTSDYEGIPNTLIEAMAMGLPVIATDCSPGGARLLIENNVNGILVPRGNVDEIAKAIIYLLDNPEIAEQYGNEALKINKRFSPERIIKMWVEFINKFVSGDIR